MGSNLYSHRELYAVYDSEGKTVKLYAYKTWANRKAAEVGGRVETFINKDYTFGIETAAWILRNKEDD